MNEIDKLSTQLLEEAKRFLEIAAAKNGDIAAQDAYLHAALLLGFSSLEAHVNAIAEELVMRTGLGVLDKSILVERDFKLKNGQFQLNEQLKIYRLEDRLLFIFANFPPAGCQQPTNDPWWSKLKDGMTLRNQLVHPKASVKVDLTAVSASLTAIIECLDALYGVVFSRPFPPRNRGLDSTLTF